MSESDSRFHNMGENGFGNTKWISPGGHMEVVFDLNGNVVTDALNVGTYNFVSPSNILGHYIFDVEPYEQWGNSPDDPSSQFDRVGRYVYKKVDAKCER